MYKMNILFENEKCHLTQDFIRHALTKLNLAIKVSSLNVGFGPLPEADIHIYVLGNRCNKLPPSDSISFEELLNTTPGFHLCMAPTLEPYNNHFIALFHDFLLLPSSPVELRTRIEKFIDLQRKPRIDDSLLDEFSKLNLIGNSPEFIDCIRLIKKIAPCNATVLIQGETGTGKENAARAIHYLGGRRDASFVPVNCAAIPDELIESELFGHEKGAFTDAKQQQAGLVNIANGGTLFLDEIDSLSPKAQAVLLRFLQTHEYRPLGAKHTHQADVRILAATNADLKELVQEKRFREDLYFRLNVLNLVMPSLRDRISDLPLIAENLLNRFAREYQVSNKAIKSRSLHKLMQLSWQGNIRELENYLLRAFLLSENNFLQFSSEESLLSDGNYLNEETTTLLGEATNNLHAAQNDEEKQYTNDKPDSKQSSDNQQQHPDIDRLSFQDAKAIAINQFESDYLQRLMHATSGNVTAAARLAGKERRALGKLLQKYEIDKKQFQKQYYSSFLKTI